jgi:predicted secreted protein
LVGDNNIALAIVLRLSCTLAMAVLALVTVVPVAAPPAVATRVAVTAAAEVDALVAKRGNVWLFQVWFLSH